MAIGLLYSPRPAAKSSTNWRVMSTRCASDKSNWRARPSRCVRVASDTSRAKADVDAVATEDPAMVVGRREIGKDEVAGKDGLGGHWTARVDEEK